MKFFQKSLKFIQFSKFKIIQKKNATVVNICIFTNWSRKIEYDDSSAEDWSCSNLLMTAMDDPNLC